MSGKRSRDKGLRRERELAKIVGGRRIPLSGAQDGFGGDVEATTIEYREPDKNDVLGRVVSSFTVWEVKSRRNGWVTLYRLLRELQTRCPDHDEHRLALKADGEPWLEVRILARGGGGDGE